MTERLTIWAVSDGRAGIENQAVGLAEAIQRLTPADITVKRIRYRPAFDWLPAGLKIAPDAMLAPGSDSLAAPYPDIWIAAGRATLPHSLRMRRRSHGKTLVVQLQDPTVGVDAFDLVVAPEHDGLEGRNVLSLVGSTNRVTMDRLHAEGHVFAGLLDGRQRPFITALIGGNSRSHVLTAERARVLADQIWAAIEATRGTLLLTFSRRTPGDARHVLTEALQGLPSVIHDGSGSNPYFAFLDAADYILVTEDSVNMAVEAAATGKPVYILGLDGRRTGGKFARFHQSLRDRGIARPFDGRLDTWTYAPLDETARAAGRVLDALARRTA